MESHEKGLTALANEIVEVLEIEEGDYSIHYWTDSDELFLNVFDFDYSIIIKPNGDDFYTLDLSFYIDIHPNEAAYVAMTLNTFPNVEIELYESFDYTEDGDIIWESQMTDDITT